MPTWGWVLIAIGILALVLLGVWQAVSRRRTGRLRNEFGPEYDRAVEGADSRGDAEDELMRRERRHASLELRPLAPEVRRRYEDKWDAVQSMFVDNPAAAVASADALIQAAMSDRGYPVEDFEQRVADISVDHPQVVENYRDGHRLARAAELGNGTTEELRRAMQHYRALFDELLGESADAPLSRDAASAEARESAHR